MQNENGFTQRQSTTEISFFESINRLILRSNDPMFDVRWNTENRWTNNDENDAEQRSFAGRHEISQILTIQKNVAENGEQNGQPQRENGIC